MALRIWYNDEGDYVIAESPEDATKVLAETADCTVEEYIVDYGPVDWSAWDDDVPFPFTEELEYEEDPPTVETLKLEPGEVLKKRGEPCDASTYYTVEPSGQIFLRTRRRLPEVWITEEGRGYFATTEN